MGRLADRHTISVQAVGLAMNVVFLSCFALFADLSIAAVVFMMGIGLVGVTMNPAMATRVQRTGNAGPFVNTVRSSCITLGVIIGSSVGGVFVDNYGLRAPLWLGAGLAAFGLLSLLPERGRRSAASRATVSPVASPVADDPVRTKLHEEV